MGVPVKPKNNALGKVRLMVINISPKVERCASSIINTKRLACIISISAELVAVPSSSTASKMLLIF